MYILCNLPIQIAFLLAPIAWALKHALGNKNIPLPCKKVTQIIHVAEIHLGSPFTWYLLAWVGWFYLSWVGYSQDPRRASSDPCYPRSPWRFPRRLGWARCFYPVHVNDYNLPRCIPYRNGSRQNTHPGQTGSCIRPLSLARGHVPFANHTEHFGCFWKCSPLLFVFIFHFAPLKLQTWSLH